MRKETRLKGISRVCHHINLVLRPAQCPGSRAPRSLVAAIRWLVVACCLVFLGQPVASADRLVSTRDRMREAMQRMAVPQRNYTNAPEVLDAFREVTAKPSQWTVRVTSQGRAVAYGLVVGPDGWILTKASQLRSEVVCRLHDGRELTAEVVGIHPDYDLAMLRVPAEDLPSVEWGDVDALRLGQWIVAPSMEERPLAVGIVSVLPRRIPKRSGVLGVVLENGERGAVITRVVPDSPAAISGLQVNDEVTHCNDVRTTNTSELVQAVRRHSPGETVQLRVLRDAEPIEMKAVLARQLDGERPDRGQLQNQMGSRLSARRSGFPTVLQHDAVLRPRDCGGPLVDLEGRVVGLSIARAGRTETYAIPARALLNELYNLMSGRLAPESKRNLTDVSHAGQSDVDRASNARRPGWVPGRPPEPAP